MKYSIYILLFLFLSLNFSCSTEEADIVAIDESAEESDDSSDDDNDSEEEMNNDEDEEEGEGDSDDEENDDDESEENEEESEEGSDDGMEEDNNEEDNMDDMTDEEEDSMDMDDMMEGDNDMMDNGDGNSGMASSVVALNGQLHVDGAHIRNQNNEIVQLRGMSLFWSQYSGDFYNANVVEWLKNDWQISIIRAAMGIQEPMGFLVNPEQEKQKVFTIIDAAIEQGIYVIVDWHSHNAENEVDQAVAFFSEVAQRYGNRPNIIYETYNEPIEATWNETLKPYHETVIAAIRQHDPNNIVVCGTRFFSQRVDEVIGNEIDDPNVAYTLHYYASTHGQELRDYTQQAIDNNLAIFVTEYGVTEATGDGFINTSESRIWWDFLDRNNISHCNWSIFDKDESSSVLVSGASTRGQWPTSMLKQAGRLVRDEIRAKNTDFGN